ncbi:MAG: SDR family NAD(P)-dependent oxidoreductase [Gammaproteobacteria bacterium]|jgi:short-subunit dehydrogenase|nr:SDR family NAD(P)-dependent oxidoreductase [Gammaproteobacteria bacterium]
MENMALVTGASAGIGEQLARIHAAKGGDLVLVARSEERLADLAGELIDRHEVNVRVVARDLAVPGAAEGLADELLAEGLVPDILINNAGFGGQGRFHERDWARDRDMINLNVMALAALTHGLLPAMVKRGSGRILNTGSVAGFLPGPNFATYFATKAFVLSFSEAIAAELTGTGVTVTVLCPGPVATGFVDAAGMTNRQMFDAVAAPAEDVARYGYRAMMRGDVIAVPGVATQISLFQLRFMPRGLTRAISRLTMGNL